MSERAREFLEKWKLEHVEPVADGKRLREAVRLVLMCRDDATCAGIPPHELRIAAQNDMIRNMLAAVDAATHLRDEPAPELLLTAWQTMRDAARVSRGPNAAAAPIA